MTERRAILFRLKAGARDEYHRRHEAVWPEVCEALKEAGISNYSIWNHEDLLFAYFEVSDPARMEEVLARSEPYLRWRDYMEDVVHIDPGGQKEWPMDLAFLLE